jgi:protein-disulfide isomerase
VKKLFQALSALLIVILCVAGGAAAAEAEPRVAVDISGHPFKGPVNAPVTVVVFSDYL